MTDVADTKKEAWVAPEIRTLDVAETHRASRRGADGCRFVDSTRS